MLCFDCPRNCGVDRENAFGFCNCSNKIYVAKIIENFMWEEPCISGKKGALAIFFAGCNLRCEFCQNYKISHYQTGKAYSPQEFRALLESFHLSTFSSIDLITPTHYSSALLEALQGFSSPIPIVWNSSGYEKPEMIDKLSTVVDVFLPDLKYFDCDLSLKHSKAKDYFQVASKAIEAMRRNKPKEVFQGGVLQEGVLIRHLVLPGCKDDSLKLLDYIKEQIQNPFVSLMSQFTPVPNSDITRALYPLEYKIVLSYSDKLGIDRGYFQDFDSSSKSFIPDF